MVEDAARPLGGRHILVVEDDYMIAADLARSLEDLGVNVVGPVGSVADALALLVDKLALDAAVLDVDLGGERVFPVADALQKLDVSFVFATGYDHWIIPTTYEDVPRLEKPVDTGALERVLSK